MSVLPKFEPSSLLSDLRETLARQAEADPHAAWPLCANGMVLRSMVLVLTALAVSQAFVADSLTQWVIHVGGVAGVAVPATLAWLLAGCHLGRWLRQFRFAVRMGVLCALGAAISAAAWWWLSAAGVAPPSPSGVTAPALAGGALAALLYQSVRWRERALMPTAAAARLADLQTRIRPHFLFNTLNTAISLVQHDPRRAEEVLEDLSELFRAALGEMDRSASLAEEVELARRYLSIEQLRFGNRLRVKWDIDPAAHQARLPRLALQPLIENAVRHGVEPQPRGSEVEIRATRRRERVLLSVTNSVPLQGPAKRGHGLGLASVRERLRLLHDLDADFRSGLIEDGRWRVSISVPAQGSAT